MNTLEAMRAFSAGEPQNVFIGQPTGGGERMIVAKKYTTAELKAIDEKLDLGDTGASQEPGWYWQENDANGELECGPCGPYKDKKAALRNAARFNARERAA